MPHMNCSEEFVLRCEGAARPYLPLGRAATSPNSFEARKASFRLQRVFLFFVVRRGSISLEPRHSAFATLI